MVADIVTEMEYLRAREQRLRDTNESRASAPMSTSSSMGREGFWMVSDGVVLF
jgi:hypothetical protein